MNFLRNKIIIGGLLIICFVSIFPIMRATYHYGNILEVPLHMSDDDLYYFSRSKDVFDRNFFIGNPYYIEHAKAVSPAFFVADWVAAIPQFLGLSINRAIEFNIIVWSVIFYLLVTQLILVCGGTKKRAVSVALLSFFALYGYVIRPVSMQIVFPFFLLFCIALILWLKKRDRNSAIMLGVAIATNFYIYTYSWQIISVAMGVGLIYLLYKKKLGVKEFLWIFTPAFFLALPSLFYMVQQVRAQFYWESLGRIGLVTTHLPTGAIFLYGTPLILVSLLVFILNKTKKLESKIFLHFFIFLVPALFITAVSNIITAKELETAGHVGRFMSLLSVISFGFIFPCYRITTSRLLTKILIVVLILGSTWFIFLQLQISWRMIASDSRLSLADQAYSKPLKWIDTYRSEPAVIFADQKMSEFIPILTKHYVLFSPNGGLQILSNDEQIERFILSRIGGSEITRNSLEKDLRLYAGVGNAVHQYKTRNKENRFCRAIKVDKLGFTCGADVTAASLLGDEYFLKIINMTADINNNIERFYTKYHVTFFIHDRERALDFAFENFFPTTVYDDGRFVIRMH